MVDSMFWTNLVEQLDERSLEKLGLNASDEDVERKWLQSLDFASWGETLPPLDLDTLPILDDDVEREFLEGLNFALWDEGLPDLGPNVLVALLGLDLPGEAIPADPPSPAGSSGCGANGSDP